LLKASHRNELRATPHKHQKKEKASAEKRTEHALRNAQRKGIRRKRKKDKKISSRNKVNRLDASPFPSEARGDLSAWWAYLSCDIHGNTFCRFGSRKEKRSSAGRGRGRGFLGAHEHAGSSTEFFANIKNIPAPLYALRASSEVNFVILYDLYNQLGLLLCNAVVGSYRSQSNN